MKLETDMTAKVSLSNFWHFENKINSCRYCNKDFMTLSVLLTVFVQLSTSSWVNTMIKIKMENMAQKNWRYSIISADANKSLIVNVIILKNNKSFVGFGTNS